MWHILSLMCFYCYSAYFLTRGKKERDQKIYMRRKINVNET